MAKMPAVPARQVGVTRPLAFAEKLRRSKCGADNVFPKPRDALIFLCFGLFTSFGLFSMAFMNLASSISFHGAFAVAASAEQGPRKRNEEELRVVECELKAAER